MNKWFESKNIASYAKTALLQAQKRIDQVLDIKEDEIIGKIATSTVASNESSNTNISNLTQSSTSPLGLSSKLTTKISNNNRDSLDFETESFFTTFLTENSTNTPNQLSKNNTRNNSPSLSENSFVQTNNSGKLNELHNSKFEESFNKKDDESKLSDKSSNKFKNNKITKQINQGQTLEIEKIEKQNWIQNYVDSNGSGSNITSEQNESQTDLVNKNKIDKISSLNLIDSESSISSVLQVKHSSTSTINANSENQSETLNDTLTNSITSNLFQDTELKINKENENQIKNENNDFEDKIFIESISNNQECSNDNKSLNEKIIDETSLKNDSPKFNNNNSTEIDFVKIDGNFSIDGTSENASSNEEGLETCVSSDIEVLSLPSTNGDQSLVKVNSINRISSLASINSNKNTKSNKKKSYISSEGSDLNSQYPTTNTSEKSHLQNKIHFIKSPPPPTATSLPPTAPTISQNMISPLSSQNINPKTKDDLFDLPNSDIEANKSILEVREAHILKLNRQNVKLQEENDNLLSEIEKIKCEAQERIFQFQKLLNEATTKCDQSTNEKEQLQKSFTDSQRQVNEVKNLLNEKETQIQQLTQEGLKLSKQELNQSNIIKKLRAKEKENEELITIQKTEIQKYHKELEELKKIIDAKQESESKNIEILKKLEKTALSFEKELTITKSNLEDSEEKVKSLENTLQNTFKELAELHKANATKENIINESTSLIENQLKEEIQSAVEKERIISNKKQESLKWELNSVRADISRIEQQHALREEMLRKEIADLQQQLIDSENRNNELSQNISTATRPLLRQIENLQSSHSNQIELLENAERNLIERLKEMQINLCEITEKYRQSQESLMDLNQVVKTYDVQLQSLKIEKSKLNAEYQLVKTNLDSYENEKYEKEAQHKILINSLNQQIDTLNREKKYIESQLDIEKAKTENDAKKFQSLLNEYTKEKEQQNKNQKIYQEQMSHDLNNSSPKILKNLDFPSLYDSARQNTDFSFSSNSGAINVLESLQSKLKQKDGEIVQLQKEIKNLEKIRESMAREMVNLTDSLEKARDQIKEFPELQDKYNKLNIEYNALLQLCGEKTEEVEELRLDLQDLKEMYKLQIEDLLKRTNI